MGSTVMATSSIFLSSGLAAIISSTYSGNEPIVDAVYGAHGDIVVALKYATILFVFLFAFLFYSLSINMMNQVIFLINIPIGVEDEDFTMTPEYMCGLLEKGFVLHIVGNRIFYAALPLLLWIFEPLLVFLCSLLMVSILYNMDIVYGEDKVSTKREAKRMAPKEVI